MSDHSDHGRMPRPDQPVNAPRRRGMGPLVLTLLILGLIALVFLAISSTAP